MSVQPQENRPILEADQLGMQFRGTTILREISFQLQRGETLAVIGESGCGKTVLLKSLIRLLTPTDGHVIFDGRDLSTLSPRELALERTRFGFVFQQAALFDSMTVGDNVCFPLKQHTRKSAAEMREIAYRLLNEVGLPETVYHKKPAELSGGMRKRVGFARALAMEPEIMLYDEPTTGLDPIMSDVINELILGVKHKRHVSGIIVTHDMKSAKKVADRIIMLYPVTRLQEGESQMIYEGPADEIDYSPDRRVPQFINGEAGERLMEMLKQQQPAYPNREISGY
ncbi:MAG: ATP-binding cassette domain-containing protein [Planctomycetaceae bacterium]|jgi:phospholipid/cholesterol/gamma-HCH transport system ATP-binding protein|nr:ATP-binding cassette domain-containing protein [Planctomycetaceae bacterium]